MVQRLEVNQLLAHVSREQLVLEPYQILLLFNPHLHITDEKNTQGTEKTSSDVKDITICRVAEDSNPDAFCLNSCEKNVCLTLVHTPMKVWNDCNFDLM